jgi:hypothetical protein
MATSKDHDSLKRGDPEWYDPLYAYNMGKGIWVKYEHNVMSCEDVWHLKNCMTFISLHP